MKLVPIPVSHLKDTEPHWFPYVVSIAERSGDSVSEMRRMLESGETQAFVAWDEEQKKTRAFMGVSFIAHGTTRTGRIIWLTGDDRKAWVHLYGDLETYLRDAEKCERIEVIARPGWKPILEGNGFKVTHLLMEKAL